MVGVARSTEPGSAYIADPGRYDQLAANHAKLKRTNVELERNLQLAKAVIQRLALDNQQLRQQLEQETKRWSR